MGKADINETYESRDMEIWLKVDEDEDVYNRYTITTYMRDKLNEQEGKVCIVIAYLTCEVKVLGPNSRYRVYESEPHSYNINQRYIGAAYRACRADTLKYGSIALDLENNPRSHLYRGNKGIK